MRKITAAATVGATLTALVLTGCGTDKDRCDSGSTMVMFFSTTDHHYHYGSPTGKVVPAASVPSSARKVPGYKAPAAPKVDLKKPGTSGGGAKVKNPNTGGGSKPRIGRR